MNFPNTPCYYYKSKIAVTKCERYNHPICLEDKRIYKRTRCYKNGVSNGRVSYSYDYVYYDCIPCNAIDTTHKKQSFERSLSPNDELRGDPSE
ncbi:MAG: hypothetical protein JSW11_21360 [Candidatus Heimdallarchaeota archaeon]|nr:MAG: hypothetical protein JSW11_21360 [Candidatus Heimdallarchaeota archaeon]